MVDIGGFLTATRTFIGLVLLPFIHIGFEHSITKAIQNDIKNHKKGFKNEKRKQILNNFQNRVSFDGIY